MFPSSPNYTPGSASGTTSRITQHVLGNSLPCLFGGTLQSFKCCVGGSIGFRLLDRPGKKGHRVEIRRWGGGYISLAQNLGKLFWHHSCVLWEGAPSCWNLNDLYRKCIKKNERFSMFGKWRLTPWNMFVGNLGCLQVTFPVLCRFGSWISPQQLTVPHLMSYVSVLSLNFFKRTYALGSRFSFWISESCWSLCILNGDNCKSFWTRFLMVFSHTFIRLTNFLLELFGFLLILALAALQGRYLWSARGSMATTSRTILDHPCSSNLRSVW